MNGTADIIDGTWRRLLTREWSDGPQVTFIMLNPSIADATRPDPTLTRCIGFAQSWGMGGLRVANLWSMVQSDPTQLWRAWAADYRDAVGPDNDQPGSHGRRPGFDSGLDAAGRWNWPGLRPGQKAGLIWRSPDCWQGRRAC